MSAMVSIATSASHDVDRVENIRRVAEVAKLMADAGLFVSCPSFYAVPRRAAMGSHLMNESEFSKFHRTPLAEAEKRDVKGLYKKARAGRLKNFTGVDSPYERPGETEIHVDTTKWRG